jgi:hypothetical protein
MKLITGDKINYHPMYNHINYIKEKLISKKPLGITHPISVTTEEEEKQSEESSMSNRELILVIEPLIGTLNEINLPKWKKNFPLAIPTV